MRLGATEAILIIPLLAIYFLPTIIAASKGKSNWGLIFLLNLLLGWTLLGWIGAFVWALTSDNKKQTIVINNTNHSNSNIHTSTARKPSVDEKMESLQKLKNLLDSGVLSQQEFDQQKAKILAD